MAGDWLRFEQLRWDGPPPACPRCQVAGRCSLLPGAAEARRVWRCGACRSQFSVLTGTLLERTRVPLPVWRAIVAEVVAGSTSGRELARRHGITPETARLMVGRITAAGVGPGDGGDAALPRLLRLPAGDVRRIRRTTPARRAGHYGPSAEFG